MRIFAGGREVEVPSDANGNAEAAEVRRIANVPNNRALIHQRPSGENHILPRTGKIHINPYDEFMEAPRGVRGDMI